MQLAGVHIIVYIVCVDADARQALRIIRSCVNRERVTLVPHFMDRMEESGMVWADVLAILDAPTDVRDGRPEKLHRPKWAVAGVAGDGLPLEVICVLDQAEDGDWTLFITIY
jgi:hypothetical protein